MKYFSNKSVIGRFHFIAGILTLAGIAIVVKAGYIMFVEADFWKAVSERNVRDSVVVQPTRGNIFSADGQLLATSLPEYKIYMDFKVGGKDSVRRAKDQHMRDSLLDAKMDSICIGLHKILPDKSVVWYRERIREGREKGSHNWLLYPERISYIDYKEVKGLPFFCYSANKSGFHVETFNECKKPFGSLASRTLGDMFPGKDSARSGLQLAYDTLLRGKPGLTRRQKVLNHYLNIEKVPPVDGADIVTTLNVKLQDYCEKSIVDELKQINGDVGIVILMEVATGDIKAIVNMTKCEDGQYREIRNNAVSNLMEPGSVFKPMSFMVAFEDGKIDMNDQVDVGGGVKMMYGRKMRDHNWRRGGYQVLTVPEILEFSSNVGVSTLIDRNYHNCPEKFVDGLYRIGVAEDLKLDIPGYARPRIRRPRKDGSNWSNTALAWMSIGYETQVPPISVLSFYNGVANGGRMMRPRFVTQALRDGEVIHEYQPVVVREHMCSASTLRKIQTCLRWVVSRGLGKKAGSKKFAVSGKTGTAQIWAKTGFQSSYLVSFAGYFPSEAPKYSCIVCIQKRGPASGALQCGPVFKAVAEAAMSETTKPTLEQAVDTAHTLMPTVEYGNLLYANKVLEDLDFNPVTDWAETSPGKTIWGRAITTEHNVELKHLDINPSVIPDLTGMGARDAVYLLERLHQRVIVEGFGTVASQSLPPGHLIIKGETIRLRLAIKGGDNTDFMPITIEKPDSAKANTVKNGSIDSSKVKPKRITENVEKTEKQEKPVATTKKKDTSTSEKKSITTSETQKTDNKNKTSDVKKKSTSEKVSTSDSKSKKNSTSSTKKTTEKKNKKQTGEQGKKKSSAQ